MSSWLFFQVAGERQGGVFLASNPGLNLGAALLLEAGIWVGVKFAVDLAYLSFLLVIYACVWTGFLKQVAVWIWTDSHCEISLGLVRVCEKLLNSKGSFFGTAASFLFWHLKNLGEPYKDQKQVWPESLPLTW